MKITYDAEKPYGSIFVETMKNLPQFILRHLGPNMV